MNEPKCLKFCRRHSFAIAPTRSTNGRKKESRSGKRWATKPEAYIFIADVLFGMEQILFHDIGQKQSWNFQVSLRDSLHLQAASSFLLAISDIQSSLRPVACELQIQIQRCVGLMTKNLDLSLISKYLSMTVSKYKLESDTLSITLRRVTVTL